LPDCRPSIHRGEIRASRRAAGLLSDVRKYRLQILRDRREKLSAKELGEKWTRESTAEQLEFYRRAYWSEDVEERIGALRWVAEHYLKAGMSRKTVEQSFILGEITLAHWWDETGPLDFTTYAYHAGNVEMHVTYSENANGQDVIEIVEIFRWVEGYPIELGATPEEVERELKRYRQWEQEVQRWQHEMYEFDPALLGVPAYIER